MINFTREQIEVSTPVTVTCNRCGTVGNVRDTDFTTITHLYCYWSQKDGDQYLSHICELCMDNFYASFTIPPQVSQEAGFTMPPESAADSEIIV